MIAASNIGILVGPQSQTVLLNENATFQCNADSPAKWKINNEVFNPINEIPPHLSERGFKSNHTRQEEEEEDIQVFKITLIVLGLPINNNTVIQCQIQTDSALLTSTPAILLVIGII